MMMASSISLILLIFTVPSLSDCEWNYGVPGEKNELENRRSLARGSDGEYSPGEYGWFVVIERLTEGEWKHACGAAIISQEHIVSAAHCFCLSKESLNCGDVNLNEFRIRLEGTKESLNSQTVNVLSVSISPSWALFQREQGSENPTHTVEDAKDISVARISPLNCDWISQGLNAIEIVGDTFNKKGCTSFVSSMGIYVNEDNGNQVEGGQKKQETFSTLRDMDYCERMHNHLSEGVARIVPLRNDERFCMFDERNPHEVLAIGDSGSPLMIMGVTEQKYYLAGVAHGGRGAGFQFTVFQDASTEFKWISEQSSTAKVAAPTQCVNLRVSEDKHKCNPDPKRNNKVNARMAATCDLTNEITLVQNIKATGCGYWGNEPCKLCCNSVGTYGLFLVLSLLVIFN